MHITNKDFSLISSCRLCDCKSLENFIDFGDVPLGNNLQKSSKAALEANVYPLNLMRCNACGHFQLGYSISKELLYATNYTYLSGIGKTFVEHIKQYVQWVTSRCELKKNSVVVDIGSNDGTCLQAFKTLGFDVQGVDPAALAAEIAIKNGIPTINSFFDSTVANLIIDEIGYVDVVTSQNVLAHVNNLQDCFQNIYKILKNDGYFVFEIGYFLEVLNSGCFDTIYHEHLDYHHAEPLSSYLTSLGFDVIDFSINSIQGGSLRVLSKKTGQGKISFKARQFLLQEKKSNLYSETFLSGWLKNVNFLMQSLNKIVTAYYNKGFTIVGYGAPTKATLLLKLSGLNEGIISYIYEDNEHKVGRYLPKTPIIICSSLDLDNLPSNNVIVILAWNFAEDIIKNIKSKVKKSTIVIIPLPHLKVINI